jgi:bile acid:Na+ symporter, BASS family
MPPETITLVNTVLVPIGLMLIMFSMGLTLQLSDFRLVLAHPRTVFGGLCGQLLLMPLLAFLTGWVLRLPPQYALGLFILGICPAGTTSNALTFVGRGNVALAVVLTALSSLITVLTIPILLRWAVTHFNYGTGQVLSLSTTMLQLIRVTIFPIALGMLLRRLTPAFSSRASKRLRPVALVILIAVIAFAIGTSAEMVVDHLRTAGPAIVLLNLAAMGVGLGIARLIGAGDADAMTLAIEVGVHNVTLATFLTLTVLHNLPLAVTQNIYGVVMVITAMTLIRWFRSRLVAVV